MRELLADLVIYTIWAVAIVAVILVALLLLWVVIHVGTYNVRPA